MGRRKLLVRTVVTAIFNLLCLCYDEGRLERVKIVTLRVGARAKEVQRGGGGEKKIRLPDIIVLLGNAARWQTEPLNGTA